ncbi:VCBS repeat-containing protein [Silvimonas terrae]|uniref:VCBS repeat-containing protein n=1 Tax=Silvimonas terrae TaxID=300266 RepID=A0A840RF40_9NEIS|nr:VCBS domain-containing protein [Silvimonas terrae]MBB5190871.1 VCBS repeat-containing protein [Silvimonas terrae]
MLAKPDSGSVQGLFRPRSHALALEPRILFDGAVAAAVEQHHSDTSHPTEHAVTARANVPLNHLPAPAVEARDGAVRTPPTTQTNLVVIDSRVDNYTQLLTQLPPGTRTLIINSGDDALASISAALQSLGKVDSIQIFSHGAAGQFTLGNQTFTADTLGQVTATLNSWRAELNPGADILLYGCDVGEGVAGKTLVNTLANLTGAGVAASSNATGSSAAGGDWVLETSSGVIDKSIALSASALDHYDGLLANASPVVTISVPSNNVLLGDQVTFNVSLTNSSSQVGYAPYIDLFMPATGKDGNDGLSFVSASYLGQSVTAFVITFDANGNATHPLAKDSSGNPLVINAATYGLRAGDQLVVLELPFASVSQSQPAIAVQVTATLSNLADTSFSNGSPDLTVQARAGFQFGNDSLDNPTVDPSIVEASTSSLAIHPTLVKLSQTIDMPEGETATGPNYVHSETITATPAAGQTLTDVTVTQAIPGNVQVTAINTGSGTLTSLTMQDGSVLTDPTAMNLAIASNTLFIRSYTVHYATLSGPTSIVVSFYVPESDATGLPVLNTQTGASVTIDFGAPSATGSWVPLDPRDLPPGETTIDFSGTGDGSGGSFLAKSITLQKQVSDVNDIGPAGVTPGDTLGYTLNLNISDYYAFGMTLLRNGSFTITDQLSDGQTLTGTPTFTFTMNGVTQTVALVATSTVNADGTTTIQFNIASSVLNAGQLGALVGDLAFDSNQDGATTASIHYTALVDQHYTSTYAQSEINEGDSFGNNATTTATVMVDQVNLSGFSATDNSSTNTTIGTDTVDIAITSVNGGTPPSSGELNPGDVVTFQMSYDLLTGDYEHMNLTAYLPLPLFDLTSINWTQGTGAGTWALGAGNTNAGAIDSVTTGPGNSVVFNLGNFATSITTGSRIEVTFTLRVGDQPYADQRSFNVLAQSDQLTTITQQHLISSDVAPIVSIAEPVLTIAQGVVSRTGDGTISSGTTGTWAAPGTSGVPFTGSVTDISTVTGSISGIDAGDTLRLATTIENAGGGGAFDVATTVTIPTSLQFIGGALGTANLQIYRGDGTALVLGTDYSVSGNTITFLDAGSVASLLPGRTGTTADTSGSNVVVITYDVKAINTIAAAATLQTSATLTHYSSVEGGTDFTPTDLIATTTEQVSSPDVKVVFAGGGTTAADGDSSASHTTGNNLVIGESMQYDLVVTLPEGSTQTLTLDDLIPAGMRLDTSFNGGLGYQLITTAAGTTALGADFGGSVTISGLTGAGGTLGNDGVGAHWTFSAATATADNVSGNNSFVIRVQLVADNVSSNQAGTQLPSTARLTFSDPDGDTANGATPVTRTVNQSAPVATAVVVEPTLQITQTLLTDPGLGVDAGDTVEYIITISNGTSATDFDAFDLNLQDVIPAELTNVQLVGGVLYQNGATNHGGVDFQLSGNTLSTLAGANIDIAKGGSITLHISGQVVAAAAGEQSFSNTATVRWTSLDGTSNTTADPAGERTGADGLLNSGALNDYRSAATQVVPIAQAVIISRVGGLPDTPAPNPTNAPSENVTIGEVIRYRVSSVVAEGTTGDYLVQVTLQNGLAFVNDGTTDIAFISNQGAITTSFTDLINSGTLAVNGNQDSAIATAITPDLSGAAPTGVFNTANHLTISTDANGNQVLTFNLGNLHNPDNDADLEGITLEFNARVLNQASNVAGAALAVSAKDISGSTTLASSQAVTENLVEPSLTGLNKQITSFDPNPTGTTGTATVAVSFTAGSTVPAFNAELADGYPSGTNLTAVSLEINGTTYAINSVPGSVGFTYSVTGNSITADFSQLDPGTSVKLIYQITLPNTATIASSAAKLTWTSLPDSFTSWGGSSVGAAGGSTGERTGSGSGPNQYVLTEGAGLGVISGTLWDDTFSATTSTTPDGTALAGQTVTLTWAGVDGDFSTTADNLTFTTTTDASGHYQFGVLAAGLYRITTPTTISNYSPTIGDLAVRIDSDAASPLGQVNITLGESATGTANVGFVEQNDAPVNHLPSAPAGQEDTPLPITGVSISDVDAGNGTMSVTLGVAHGTLSMAAVAGVTITGQNSGTLTLSGTTTNINTALAGLIYLGNLNYNGSDTLTITTNDNGNFGDHNGNGIPGEPGDALITQNTLQINIAAVNDAPVGVNDTASATEAGGTNNSTVGIDPRGNVLTNDTDVDIATNGDSLRVISIQAPGGPTVLLPAGAGNIVTGLYGSLFVNTSGGFEYTVNNSDPAVQALRTFGQTLTDTFTYTLSDTGNAHATATITITIHGANDTPVGVDDTGNATEAGGVNNGSGGSNATGNVLTNDTDVDSAANGEVLHVTGVRNTVASDSSPLTTVNSGTTSANGTQIVGTYGTLIIGADGTYRYVVDNSNPTVQALVPSSAPLVDHFSYQVTDAGGLSALANLAINVHGSYDNPVATDNTASATAGSALLGVNPVNPIGNVITDDNGHGVDSDVDAPDQVAGALTVTGARTGPESAGGALSAVTAGSTSANGLGLTGSYGTLHLGANGSYEYDVDSTNAAVRALPAGATLTETFTYQITDTEGLTDTAQLVVTVTGVNDPPVANPDTAHAVEAGGVNNQTAGVNPGGNVLTNDADPDGDAISVTGIQTSGGTTGTVGSALVGTYGSLTLAANGQYTYTVDNNNAAVQALRTASDQLTESFTYTVADSHGATTTTTLTITITGQNDAPVGVNDTGDATEAGGTNNGTPGSNAIGNVLTNDTDVDAGDSKTVDGVGTSGSFNAVTGPTSVTGQYGTLTLNTDGSYTYVVDNSLAAVNALAPGESLADTFSYRLHDTAGAQASAQLQITIHGANDAPVGHTDLNYALADNGSGTPVNANGNVLNNDTDVDHNDHLTVTGAAVGATASSPTLSAVTASSTSTSNALTLVGTYGTLTIGADGSYSYIIDINNPTVQSLTGTQFRLENFTYQLTDSGNLHDVAQLTIIVRGRNDPPVAVNDSGVAVEAAGLNNTTPGSNPTGNVLTGATDPDNDVLEVTTLHTGGQGSNAPSVTAGTPLQGEYGSLVLNGDGTWTYELNNDLPAVQALRTPTQTLTEQFTFVVSDPWGATDSATLTIVISGRNDTPIAVNDTATATEAGGVNNGAPGVNPTGNVLANDIDVDSVANGETKAVDTFSNSNGSSANAGSTLTGTYGSLTLNADGSYQYVVDNNNATVQALRPGSTPLTEVFTYQMQDAAGAQSVAHLTISIQGANDNPVAHDDTNVATDQTPAPQATGNVLPNDTDVDAGDQLTVVGIHTDGKEVPGTTGTIGQPIAGHYGTLTLKADGSYSYVIDMTNPDVLKAAGAGQVLHDTFTYTVSDQAGATDQAVLTINLDISAPYIPPSPPIDVLGAGPNGTTYYNDPARTIPVRNLDPVVFVTPVVQQTELVQTVSAWEADGSDLRMGGQPIPISPSIGAGLGVIPGLYVTTTVRDSSLENAENDAWVMGRHSRVDLTADGLLSDPSVFAVGSHELTRNAPAAPHAPDRPAHPAHPARPHGKHPAPKVAQGFKAQLQAAAPALPPIQTHEPVESEA